METPRLHIVNIPRLHVIALVLVGVAFSSFALWFEVRSNALPRERPAAVAAPSNADEPDSPALSNEVSDFQQLG